MNLKLFYKVEIMCVRVIGGPKKMAHKLSLQHTLFLECF